MRGRPGHQCIHSKKRYDCALVVGPSLVGLCEIGLDSKEYTGKNNNEKKKMKNHNVELSLVAVGSSLVGLCEVGLDSSASTTKSTLIDYFVVGLSLAGLCEIGLDSKGFQGKNRLLMLGRPSWVYARSAWTSTHPDSLRLLATRFCS